MELNMYAYDIRKGDYLEMTRENGKAFGGSHLVEYVSGNDTFVEVTVTAGMHSDTHSMPANTPVTVWRNP